MAKRLAIVTGGTRGIGHAMVKELCKKFVGTVLFTGRNPVDCKRVADNFRKDGYNPIGFPLDLGDENSIKSLVDFVSTKFEGLDVLVNNAATEVQMSLSAMKFVGLHAEETIRINFFGTLNLCRSLFPFLRPHARVVNMCGSLGVLTRIPSKKIQSEFLSPDLTEEGLCSLMDNFVFTAKMAKHLEQGWGGSAYVISKIGIVALTFLYQKQFNADEREDLIINAVHPGYVDTNLTSFLGPLTPDQGAMVPCYVALLPPNVAEPKGQLVWSDKTIVDWTSKTLIPFIRQSKNDSL